VLAVIVLFLWPVLRCRQLRSSFGRVEENDSKDLVLRKMGNPWKDEECGKYLAGETVSCVEEFTYAHPYAPYVPEYWVVDFNSSHQVINRVHLISP
jgi:hypothetical protein